MPPDTPVKHSDIIQQGNPFDDTIRGLEQTIRLVKVAAREWLKFAKAQDASTKKGRENIQKVAKATAELSSKERDAIKIKKQLRREREKLRSMDTPEFKALVKTKEAVRAKSAEMRKAAKVMRTGIKSTNKWSKALGSFAFKFNALGNIAANVASKISRSINRALRDAFSIVRDFDQAMADVKAVTKASAKDFDKLSRSARSLGGVTKFTATEVAKLQKAYAKLGFTTDEILKAQAATLDLAAATNAELPRAAEVVGITIRQFGLNAREAARVTDVMSKSFTTSALDMEKFAEAMKFVGPAAKASGISIERTTAILGQLADAGISGSMAGTSLRQIMLALSKESGTFSEKIARAAESGLDLAGAADEVQKRAATALLVLADGVDTIDDYTEALENAARSTADMANVQLDTLEGALTLVKSAWEGMTLAMLASDENISTLKSGLTGLIDVLTALGIKAEVTIEGMVVDLETGERNLKKLNFVEALAIAQATRDAANFAIELDKSNRGIDDLVDGFSKIGGWMRDLGKDLWAELFPKESGEEAVQVFEDISKLIAQLKAEGDKFTEEDQEAVGFGSLIVGKETQERAKAILDKIQTDRDNALAGQFQKDEAARKAQEKADADAEDLKQKKIQETFDLANRLTTTFTQIFATQKAKELAIFESKQVRQLAAAAGNAEQTAAITKKLAEEREEIEKKFAKKEQALAIGRAIISGASAIMKTQANLGWPIAIPFMIASAALSAAQIGIIASQKFEEGGPIIGESHSRGGVNVEAEGGEYIINKRSTSKYSDLIRAINTNDSASIANAALQNEAFHDVWSRAGMNNVAVVNHSDPYIKKMYEIMLNTPQVGPYKDRIEYYPNGKTRIING